jgi:D-methionine transport system permease protein
VPETLGPLILGFTFLFVGIVDMTAIAGAIGAGGLGDFALVYGYQRFNDVATWTAVAVIVVIVQLAQLLGNGLARRILRR